MKHLIKLVLLFVVAQNVWAAQTPDPNCPLDFFYLGYDVIKGNPTSDNADPGWQLAIMDEIPNDSCLTCTAATTCAAQYYVFDMDTTLDYYYSLTQKASISESSEDFFGDTSFSGSAEYYYQQEDVFGLGLVNVQAEGACQLYQGGRDLHCYNVNFKPGFLNFVEELPTSTSEPGWYDIVFKFIDDYGTHIVSNELSLGARWSYESQFAKVDYEALRAGNVDIAVAAEASAEFFRTKGASGEYESAEVKEMRIAFDAAVQKQRAIFLGAPPPVDLSFGAWVNEIENPIPQKYKLVPMSELFTSRFFPNDPDIEAKRAVLEAGYVMYMPEAEKIVHVFESETGKYETKNSLSVSCPADYQLISGGCKSEPNPDKVQFWIIASAKPTHNTFNCTVNLDYSSEPANRRYYKGLDVSASCLHNNYIDERIIVGCQGGIGGVSSECIAECPAGYDVTGGGCESDSANEVMPWKVVRSSPVYNASAQWSGWSCRMNRDHDSGIANKTAHGYAICVRYEDNALKDKKIISKRSGTAGHDMNGNVVTCDAGYEILSGGCIVPAIPDTADEWKTVETLPVGSNALSCYAQRDAGSTVYNLDVQTDALCILLNDLK